MVVCAFCEKSTSSDVEHVIGKWLSRLLNPDSTGIFRVESQYPARQWKSREVSLVTRSVCRDCNSGWMSRLESDVKPILSPMIHGETSQLSLESQKLITTWLLKTAFVVDVQGADVTKESFFTQSERELFRQSHRSSPCYWGQACLGRYSGRLVHVLPQHLTFFDEIGYPRSQAYCLSLVLGPLVAQLLMYRPKHGEPSLVCMGERKADWHLATLPVWPATQMVTWPPVQSFDDAGIKALHDRYDCLPNLNQ